MPDTDDDRPNNREVENENLRPAGDGKPPRPATEPSSKTAEQSPTATDPGSGEARSQDSGAPNDQSQG